MDRRDVRMIEQRERSRLILSWAALFQVSASVDRRFLPS
jgi:hypothetical protein